MGRYLSAYLRSSAANKTLRSFCKIRYLMILLRRCPCQPEASLRLSMRRTSPPAFSLPALFTTNPAVPRLIRSDRIKEVRRLDFVRLYSSSGRNAVKAEAPVGIVEEAESDLATVGGRLGQSFSRLSAHINFYFKRKETLPVVVTPGFTGRSMTRELNRPREDKDKVSETASSPQGGPDLQLFHISSLATAFGQSYSYVSNHINSAFSHKFSQVPAERNLEEEPLPAGTPRKLRRRKQHSTANSEVRSDASQAAVRANSPSGGWEEGYRLLARHINRYFGATVANEQDQKVGDQRPEATSQQKQEGAVAAPPRGLFHHSRHATDFGESYFQTASHINQYFKGGAETDGDVERDLADADPGSATPKRSVSLMDCLRHPASAIPDLLGAYFNTGPLAQAGTQRPAATSTRTALKKKVRLASKNQLQRIS